MIKLHNAVFHKHLQDIRRQQRAILPKKSWLLNVPVDPFGELCDDKLLRSSDRILLDFDEQERLALTNQFQPIQDIISERKDESEWLQCEMELKTAMKEANLDLRTTESVLEFLDQTHWPIGVYLCFTASKSPEEGWMSVWQGVRQGLVT
jgi:hypothetical protein